ncbi:MAG: zinc ribbon domain-containing protein [Dokdonella sp.]
MALQCNFDALSNLDQTDSDAMQALLQVCTEAAFDPTLWIWAIGITLGCAIVGAVIGLAKGRWVAGLVWGAALGPIGWIVIALSKSSLLECPECGHRNVPSAKACRHCGVNLSVAAKRSVRASLKRNDSGRGW